MKIKREVPSRSRLLSEILVYLVLSVTFSSTASGQAPSTQQNQAAPKLGSASRGEALFVGEFRFRNGGPPCISCHSIAGIPFPNGGTLGPDLTKTFGKLGAQGIQPAMQTLFFKVMTPIYDQRPLTSEEQSDLIAFFREAASGQAPRWNTQILAGAGIVGLVLLLVVTGLVWQDRLKSVRRTLVGRAARQEGDS